MNATEHTTSTIGFSDEAENLLNHFNEVEYHAQDVGSVFYKLTKLIEALEVIYLDAENGNYDNYGASHVNVKTFREVYKFINLFPYDLKELPDILLEPAPPSVNAGSRSMSQYSNQVRKRCRRSTRSHGSPVRDNPWEDRG